MDKVLALGKMAWGTSQIVSGVLLATGQTVVGAALYQHHYAAAAMKFGTEKCKKGADNISAGWDKLVG